MHLLCYVEEQEIRPVIQVIIKPVGFVEGNDRIDGVVVQGAFDAHVLVCEDVFGVVEIDLESPAFFFVEEEAQAVVILRDADGFLEKTFVPSLMVMGLDMHKIIIIAQGGLRDMDGAMGIPFAIIPPGCIYFLDKVFLLLWRLLLGKADERDTEDQY